MCLSNPPVEHARAPGAPHGRPSPYFPAGCASSDRDSDHRAPDPAGPRSQSMRRCAHTKPYWKGTRGTGIRGYGVHNSDRDSEATPSRGRA